MAIKFSKNGKPLGRTKSALERNNKQWSPEEDNYLRIAVAEGLSAITVAERLCRTAHSVRTRKWSLGIEGRLQRPTKKVVAVSKTKKVVQPKSQLQIDFQPGILELESNVPLPTKHGRNEEARNKMRELLNKMQPGQSFVVPQNMFHPATYLINKEYGSFKTRSTPTTADKKFYRIFRIA